MGGRWVGGEFAFVSPAKAETLNQNKARPGDLIFTQRGTLGQVSIVPSSPFPEYIVSQSQMKITVDPTKADVNFLYYAFCSAEQLNYIKNSAIQTGVPHTNLGILKRTPVRLPSLSVQRSVANILGALDDRIALLREINKTLESIVQAIFKSWFVDFDPVRAKMEGRQPEGMDEETAALFPDSFEESELGLIPTQWSACSFHEMIRIIGGGTPKTSNPDYWGGHIPWYSVIDVPSGADTFVVNTEKKITQAGLDGSSTKLLPFGTTIISARGTVGKLALTGCEMAMNQSCYGLRGQNNDIYFTYFSTQRLVEHLKQQAHGSVFDTITTATFKGVRVVSPPPSIIARFETNMEVHMERMLVNLKTLTSLAQLRDTLLPRLTSGQLLLPEAQEQVENALQ